MIRRDLFPLVEGFIKFGERIGQEILLNLVFLGPGDLYAVFPEGLQKGHLFKRPFTFIYSKISEILPFLGDPYNTGAALFLCKTMPEQ